MEKDMMINVDTGKLYKECELNRSYASIGCNYYYDESDTVCKRVVYIMRENYD